MSNGVVQFSNISLNTDGENYFQTIMSVLVFSQVRCPHWTVWVISPQKTQGANMWAVFWNVIIVSSSTLDSGLFFPWSDMSYLLCVFSVGRWWVGLYHVWSTGITGVFCRAAQVSQCGSLSKGVSNISLWKSNPIPESWCLFLLICFTTGNSTNPQNILTMIAEKESSLFSPCQKGTLKL